MIWQPNLSALARLELSRTATTEAKNAAYKMLVFNFLSTLD